MKTFTEQHIAIYKLHVTFITIVVLQDDSERKVNILGGNIIGRYEKKSSQKQVSNYEFIPR